MPWKSQSSMEDELKQFIETWLERRRSFAQLCREAGVSRKTGYKWLLRYKAQGQSGLVGQSTRPHGNGRSISQEATRLIMALRKKHPVWGPKKLRALMVGRVRPLPAASTIGEVLSRAGLINKPTRGRSSTVRFWPLGITVSRRPNQVWTADFKGWFLTQNGSRCDGLTVCDAFTRYILAAELVPQQTFKHTQRVFSRLFACYGLPERIRVDNGPPFGSPGPAGLSQLSVWWLSLDIAVEFTRLAKPQDNGSHERMHRTLKVETATPPAWTWSQQRNRLRRWRHTYNKQRPNEALKMQVPAGIYRASARQLQDVKPWRYPKHYHLRRVSTAGEIKWQCRPWFIGGAFANRYLGLVHASAEELEVYFQDQLLGKLYERQERRFEPRIRARRKPRGEQSGANGAPSAVQPRKPRREKALTGSPACTAVSPCNRR